MDLYTLAKAIEIAGRCSGRL